MTEHKATSRTGHDARERARHGGALHPIGRGRQSFMPATES